MNDIGVIGLAVMGENLVLNIESRGYKVSVFNRTTSKVENFVNGRAKEKKIEGFFDVESFVKSLSIPRKIMLMVKAGSAVDQTIQTIKPFLDKGDIIIDGGNSNYQDTIRRTKQLEEEGFLYVGTGVSGGELGALNGPSIMPGGSFDSWKHIQNIFEDISAKYNGVSCARWIGPNGAGHFVKMVHNGIEYADMQIISEAYSILKNSNYTNEEISDIFFKWNEGKLKSYLIEITAQIFNKKENEEYVIDIILDSAGQKGTGKWTSIEALNLGIPLNNISDAVFSRYLSSLVTEREKFYNKFNSEKSENQKVNLEELEQAVYVSKIISYAQGFELIKKTSKEYEWNINFSDVAAIWREGCIIRSEFLNDIMSAFDKSKENIMLDDFFSEEIKNSEESIRNIANYSIKNKIPTPVILSTISYFDSIIQKRSSANLIQAQRDFFGAHTYERIDKPKGEFYHTNWTGKGGKTSSTNYNA